MLNDVGADIWLTYGVTCTTGNWQFNAERTRVLQISMNLYIFFFKLFRLSYLNKVDSELARSVRHFHFNHTRLWQCILPSSFSSLMHGGFPRLLNPDTNNRSAGRWNNTYFIGIPNFGELWLDGWCGARMHSPNTYTYAYPPKWIENFAIAPHWNYKAYADTVDFEYLWASHATIFRHFGRPPPAINAYAAAAAACARRNAVWAPTPGGKSAKSLP